MVRQVMPEFSQQKNVIILCDSWYMKQNLVSIIEEYENLRPENLLYADGRAVPGR